MARMFYRLVKTNPPTSNDMLSQAALHKPPPRPDPEFLVRWAGLSVFDNEDEVRDLGRRRRWKIGAYIAILRVPDDAPFTCVPPEEEGSGHWLLYDNSGRMIDEDGAYRLLPYVVSVVHGPSTER